ncbi:thermonuclease family protein [Agrobacterium sp. ES01]|uniref:thermonuclease family protein n=1 Tax=Agrobacterium sp. ES01 TaxID=3420714 RepID=UPI003D110ECE
MHPVVTLLCGMAALSIIALLIVAAPDSQTSGVSVATDRELSEAAQPEPFVIENRAVRLVSPKRFASPLATDLENLERVAPREPFTRPHERKERVKVVLLSRPRSLAAGLISVKGRKVRFRDVEPTDVERQCAAEGGDVWPCGMVALTHQRMLLRSRSVSCEHDGADWQGVLVTTCNIGDIDIGAWLAKHGWAEVTPGTALEELADEARTARRGLYGGDPR